MVVMEKRNTYKPEYKAKIVLEVLREEKTVNQIAAEHQISPQMVSK
jgi:putative transposase